MNKMFHNSIKNLFRVYKPHTYVYTAHIHNKNQLKHFLRLRAFCLNNLREIKFVIKKIYNLRFFVFFLEYIHNSSFNFLQKKNI